MDDPVDTPPGSSSRRGLLVTALAPVVPQLLGSAFNIWYNATVIDPLLSPLGLKPRFIATIIVYNLAVYPLAIAAWIYAISSLRPHFRKLARGEITEDKAVTRARRLVVNLPWLSTVICAAAWLLCIPVFLLSLAATGKPLGAQLYWHLPISFLVSAFIAITQTFFLTELASHWGLFPVFFRGVRPDQLTGIYPLSLRGRGWMWAISAGFCPIGSLLLLSFAPSNAANDPRWLAVFVAAVGIAFGLCSAALISRLVANPVDELRTEAAKQILARGSGVGGSEQVVTIMFVDIRGFTSRSAKSDPAHAVALLNEFLGIMVDVVEAQHGGMVNKFLGDGFMATFGAGAENPRHADDALRAGRAMRRQLDALNARLAERGEAAIEIGIGINTGAAIVGSIGSPERLEFTVIGSAVNLASRIEALTKIVGRPLLMTEMTAEALLVRDGLHDCGRHEVRGVDQPVRVFAG